MQKHTASKLNAIICQTSPIFKQRDLNISGFDRQLEAYSLQDRLDIIIFPEMSFTGYNFKDLQELLSLSLSHGKGPQFQYASSLAQRLKCYVLVGYVQRQDKEGKINLYNSALLTDRQGKVIYNYRKNHMWLADQKWQCQQGNQFGVIDIVNGQGQSIRCAIGICKDISPRITGSSETEMADHIIKEQAEILILIANWPNLWPEDANLSEVIRSFWRRRLAPVEQRGKPFLLVVANRVGAEYDYSKEKQAEFAGFSSVISFKPYQVVQSLDQRSQAHMKTCLSVER